MPNFDGRSSVILALFVDNDLWQRQWRLLLKNSLFFLRQNTIPGPLFCTLLHHLFFHLILRRLLFLFCVFFRSDDSKLTCGKSFLFDMAHKDENHNSVCLHWSIHFAFVSLSVWYATELSLSFCQCDDS